MHSLSMKASLSKCSSASLTQSPPPLTDIVSLYLRNRITELKKEELSSEKIDALRTKLQGEIAAWRQIQLSRFPLLRNEHDSKCTISSDPETENLLLPSLLTPKERAAFGLSDLTKVEYSLQEAHAHESLSDLRLSIKAYYANIKFKKTHVTRQRQNTRAQAIIQILEQEKKDHAARYRCHYHALINLGFPPNDKSLQVLEANQLWMKDVMKKAEMGDSRKEDPWFWIVGRPRGLTKKEEAEWSVERKPWSPAAPSRY